jgi:uncharacterized protein (TIGR03067 family)
MKNTYTLLLALVILGTVALADDERKDAKLDELGLFGSYQIVACNKGTEKIDAEKFRGITVRIASNTITTFDDNNKEIYSATYELDKDTKPWRIMMTATMTPIDAKDDSGRSSKAIGLIEKDSNLVKLIYALPGGNPPKSFNPEEKQHFFVLKKIVSK